MKNLFKKLAATIACVTTIFTLAACGGKDSGGSKNPNVPDNGTITVMLLEKGLGKDFLNDVRDDFYNETGITVEVYGDPNIDENIKNMMLTGDAPDDIYLTGLTYDWINWVNSGNIEDLTDLCNEKYDDGKTINDKIAPEIRNLGKIGDHRFIIQLPYCPTGIVYNQDMLNDLYEKKLVDSNVFPTDWNALVKLAKDVSNANYKYKNNSKKTYGIVWGTEEEDLMDTYKTLWAQTDYEKYSAYFNQSGDLDKSLFVNDATKKALEALYDLIDPVGGKSTTSVPQMLTTKHTDGYESFLRGEALMCFAGSWFESEERANISDDTFRYRFAPVPALDGNEINVNINYPTEYFFIPKNSENTEKAKKFLKYIFKEENLVKMHNALQTPLAFEYDTSSLNLTDWGKDVQNMMNYKKTVSGSTSLNYLLGGLRPEITGKVFDKMYKGTVTRDGVESLLNTDFTNKSGDSWYNTKTTAADYESKFREKGLIK